MAKTSYANLLPPLSTEEFAALRADIKAHGMRYPILVDEEGVVLDGHHRLKIDKKAKRNVVKDLSAAEKKAFVFRCNFARRNLSVNQKQAALEAMKAIAAELRQEDPKKWTNEKVGVALGVHESTIRSWFPHRTNRNSTNGSNDRPDARVKVPAKEKPKICERLDSGEAQEQVAADYGVTQRAISKIAQKERTNKQNKKRRAKEAAEGKGIAEITRAKCEDWIGKQEPCDLLLTDPPYMTEVENIDSFAEKWLPLALKQVKPTGRVFVFIGAYPDELWAYLNVWSEYSIALQQILVWTYRNTLGPSPKYDYKLNWQAILYGRGPKAPKLDCNNLLEQFTVQDINAPDGRLGDRFHTWQKPDELADRLIRQTTKPGDLILDPFAGTGTFVLAAKRLGRIGRGCETSPKMLKIAKERGLA